MFTGMEIGILYSIVCKVFMSYFNLWPYDVTQAEEETLEEQIILASLCIKCNINSNLPKMVKLEKI